MSTTNELSPYAVYFSTTFTRNTSLDVILFVVFREPLSFTITPIARLDHIHCLVLTFA